VEYINRPERVSPRRQSLDNTFEYFEPTVVLSVNKPIRPWQVSETFGSDEVVHVDIVHDDRRRAVRQEPAEGLSKQTVVRERRRNADPIRVDRERNLEEVVCREILWRR